jgi:hypothetical protein
MQHDDLQKCGLPYPSNSAYTREHNLRSRRGVSLEIPKWRQHLILDLQPPVKIGQRGQMASWKKRTRSAAVALSVAPIQNKRRKTENQFQQGSNESLLPGLQSALLLHATKTPYDLTTEYAVPAIQHDTEILVKVEAAGLNPIDWKAP